MSLFKFFFNGDDILKQISDLKDMNAALREQVAILQHQIDVKDALLKHNGMLKESLDQWIKRNEFIRKASDEGQALHMKVWNMISGEVSAKDITDDMKIPVCPTCEKDLTPLVENGVTYWKCMDCLKKEEAGEDLYYCPECGREMTIVQHHTSMQSEIQKCYNCSHTVTFP